MFSHTCEKCSKAEQFNHYPLATTKLIEKYSNGVIENIKEQNMVGFFHLLVNCVNFLTVILKNTHLLKK